MQFLIPKHSPTLISHHLNSPPACMCMLNHFSHIQFFTTLWTVAQQAPLPKGVYRQEYGVDCHALLQGIFLIQGSNLRILHLLHWQAGFCPLATPVCTLFSSPTEADVVPLSRWDLSFTSAIAHAEISLQELPSPNAHLESTFSFLRSPVKC